MNQELRKLVHNLEEGDELEAFEAAKRMFVSEYEDDTAAKLASALIRVLHAGLHAHNRAAAAYVLGVLRVSGVAAALEEAVVNPSESSRVRGYAAEALAHNSTPRTVDILLDCLKNSDSEVRYDCIFALGQIGDIRAVPALKAITQQPTDESWDGHSLREEAVQALEQIEG